MLYGSALLIIIITTMGRNVNTRTYKGSLASQVRQALHYDRPTVLADISTKSILDMGDEKLTLTEVFLSNLIVDENFKECESKIKNGVELIAEDKLKLMLCPLSKR